MEHIRNGIAVTCPFNNCSSVYNVASSIKSHISKYHKEKQSPVDLPETSVPINESEYPTEDDDVEQTDYCSGNDENESSNNYHHSGDYISNPTDCLEKLWY